jgi:hypothetical protein
MSRIRKIYTAEELAKRLKKSRMWISMLWRQGRLPHDLEDHSGRPYWLKLPKIELMKKGRPKAEEQRPRPPSSRKSHGE